jgi:hypothetical protein
MAPPLPFHDTLEVIIVNEARYGVNAKVGSGEIVRASVERLMRLVH